MNRCASSLRTNEVGQDALDVVAVHDDAGREVGVDDDAVRDQRGYRDRFVHLHRAPNNCANVGFLRRSRACIRGIGEGMGKLAHSQAAGYADQSLVEPRARASVLHTRTDGATGIMSNCSLEASRMLLTMLRRADVLE